VRGNEGIPNRRRKDKNGGPKKEKGKTEVKKFKGNALYEVLGFY
jgi:hypothetical protein